MIKLNNITKIFTLPDKKLTALDNVSLHVPKGQICGVIGASGAGKSTLIRCVNLLERPTHGAVVIDDVDLTQLSDAELVKTRRQIGMIFQHFNLLTSRTVFENVALPLELENKSKAEIQEKTAALLALVGLSDKRNVYPANLSGGQKQRVAIARALASDPKVLLCDEATSALDPATTQSILKLLKEINRTLGITILLITHEMEVVKRICDQVAVIDKGRLIEQGTVSEIFSNPKTELAQEFISSTFHITLPEEYLENLSDTPKHAKSYPIIKFEFTGRSVDAPLLSQASKKFGVELSILTSQIDYAGGVKFGFTIAEVEGDEDAITQAKVYLMENNVRVEVLGYVQ
ncbi:MULTISPECIES: methionine ABC transporter ATP-binding protein MetN [Haemophilus]|jgi:D-methionine ABC transporter, ATP-binding protein|uniref:methionine ABC transporter ATP-binding protein MetN n=1 Tax=Haemophilus TaxID=724 RepID=UPI00066EDFD1|nr:MULTISPECIES: methionine ABC transporter ATP-binding protein MetN [Haemophilus]MDU1235467.1 methionine ABC transporter ATP-binding protein MetN [Haemophilus parainfluenzae]MDU3503323.1 methionine ABC transporter ATP-binding protein MetN [Haemophilus parainfluenzae]MDU4565774.1 methionine ABC transporter ATP-binding protein MetN [Haemophilus parainfluenzae]MDU4637610.1 methionine ABC transporter ATP-binding protein MetN [Haemophilus parainfluenzae]MDU5009393.1 methionine ABC transporter ATP-